MAELSDVIVPVLLAAVVAVGAVAGRRLLLRAPASRWVVSEHTGDAGRLTVACESQGERPWVVGYVTQGASDRFVRISELRAEALEICMELNESKSRRKR